MNTHASTKIKTKEMVDMREHISDRAAYARMLAEDGAYFMAADTIDRLGKELREHAEAKRRELEELVG